MLSAVDRLFVTVIVFGALVVFAVWVEKVRLVVESLTGKTPMPVNGTVCGLLGPSSFTVRVPVLFPAAVGLNVRETVQLVLAASVLGEKGQLEVCEKSPEVEMPEIPRATV